MRVDSIIDSTNEPELSDEKMTHSSLLRKCLFLYFITFGHLCVGEKLEKRFIKDVSLDNIICASSEIHFHATAGSRIFCVELCAKALDCGGAIFRHSDKQCYGLKKGSACNTGTSPFAGAHFYKYEEPAPECSASSPLVGSIPNNQMTSQSYYTSYYPWNGRIDGSAYWAAGDDTLNEYIQVDFLTPRIVTAVVTQGASVDNEWFTSYKLLTSIDCLTWDERGTYAGNNDRMSHVTHQLATAILARCVRFNPQSWYGWPSGRIEVHGCMP